MRSGVLFACAPMLVATACGFLVDTDDLSGRAGDLSDAALSSDGAANEDAGVATNDAQTSADVSLVDAATRCGRDGSLAFGPKTNLRGGTAAQIFRAGYDLNGTLLAADETFVAFWDHEGTIARAEASTLDGPFHSTTSTDDGTFDTVLFGRVGEFDQGVSNPSIVNVNGTFYMYYVGLTPSSRMIGVASSATGSAWTRLNAGLPILGPIGDPGATVDGSSAFYADGKFYLAFSDESAPGATGSGDVKAGVFLVRSADPTFPENAVESLTATGWVTGHVRDFALVKAINGDVAYVPELQRIVLLETGFGAGLHSSRIEPPFDLVSTPLTDTLNPLGPGLLRTPAGTLPLATDCTTLAIDYLREVASDSAGTDLGHVGFDITTR